MPLRHPSQSRSVCGGTKAKVGLDCGAGPRGTIESIGCITEAPHPNFPHDSHQGAVVKQLKKDGAGAEVLEPEVAKLLALRAELDAARKAQADGEKDGGAAFNRTGAFPANASCGARPPCLEP